MIRINLLPPEIHAAKKQKQLTVVAGAVASLVVLFLILLYGFRFVHAQKLQRDLNKAKEEEQKYQAIANEVAQMEQTRNQLKARRDVIQTLLKGRLTYPRFFEDFMALLPADIWVTSLNTTPPQGNQPGQMRVTVSAQSLSNFAIADWMTNLMGSSYVSQVELGPISAQESEEGRPALLTFTMTFQYSRGDV